MIPRANNRTGTAPGQWKTAEKIHIAGIGIDQ